MDKETIKQNEIKGYVNYVRAIRADSKRRQEMLDAYLEEDLESAAARYKDDPKFLKALEVLQLRGGEKVLEFGAGRALSSYHFALLGCDVTATDFNESVECGLGAVPLYGKFSDVKIKTVVADIEEHKFASEFDVVYCNHVLHHATDMLAMVRNAVSGLKRGGMFVAQSEVMRPPFLSDKNWRAGFYSAECGANEHLYSTFYYMKVLRKAGLRDVRVVSLVSHSDITGSKSLKGRIAARILGNKEMFAMFKKVYAYLGIPGNAILLYGWKP